MPDLEVLRTLKGFLVDLDGVVYRGERAMPGASQFFSFLRREGLPFCLLTNNSTRTAKQVVAKLAGMGIAVGPDDVLTSAEATAEYLRAEQRSVKRVLVLGGEGLREALKGWTQSSTNAECVVAGLDVKLTYDKLARAASAIRGGACFVASNIDATLPTESGELPGAGALVAALQVASGVSPFVVGKPNAFMPDLALRRMGLDRSRVAIIGDRIETDVAAGNQMGLCTILTLTGVTRREDLAQSRLKPGLVFDDLGHLCRALESERSSLGGQKSEFIGDTKGGE